MWIFGAFSLWLVSSFLSPPPSPHSQIFPISLAPFSVSLRIFLTSPFPSIVSQPFGKPPTSQWLESTRLPPTPKNTLFSIWIRPSVLTLSHFKYTLPEGEERERGDACGRKYVVCGPYRHVLVLADTLTHTDSRFRD